jgi:citrate lyase subunit beta/citryl-CoA lyase
MTTDSRTMPLRSLLFVPADSERKLAKAASLDADALIFDLEDAVLPARKPEARRILGEFLRQYAGQSQAWVRINDLSSGELLHDLAVAARPGVVGVVLPKIRGPEDLDTVGYYLEAAEALNGLAVGSLKIIAVCTETPEAVLRMGELARRRHSRLSGLMWGAEDLSSALAAGDPRMDDGAWRPVYVQARTQCLLAAHALGVEAIDTVYVDIRNHEGCRRSAQTARHDGFTGKIAVHPDQVAVINAVFTPSEEEIAHARRVVDAFADGAGAVQLGGKMLDIPHLKAAQRVLGSAGTLR